MSKVFLFFTLMAVFAHSLVARESAPYTRHKNEAAESAGCRVEQINYLGWLAEQVSNPWLKLIFVPQNGGRLMQVVFDGHPFLFVNQRFAGKSLPPSGSEWFNYGGDKLWVLPEGNQDEKHWAGNSDLLDDGKFDFQAVTQGQRCEILMTGPADPQTGLQFTRTVSLGADSPLIKFHSVIKNASGHPVEWSVQSVSQYDTADAKDPSHHNRNFWAFSKANPSSAYLDQYHVKFGPAENSAPQVRASGIFALHYVPLAAELWLDSKDGWLAVVDGDTRYAMVERFWYDETKQYPGKASVIFWTNGLQLRQHPDGTTTFGHSDEPTVLYMEAELNSPMTRLVPGESFQFDTEWLPTRADSSFQGVTDAGVILKPLRASHDATQKVRLAGSFGVFFAGKLVARLYDAQGLLIGTQDLPLVDPRNAVLLQATVADSGRAHRISLHLIDSSGLDRGALGEVILDSSTENE
jgi:hypothetical protein